MDIFKKFMIVYQELEYDPVTEIGNVVDNFCLLIIEEVIEILQYNYLHIDFLDKDVDLGSICPIYLHCAYSTD